jgi:hypothetical protein
MAPTASPTCPLYPSSVSESPATRRRGRPDLNDEHGLPAGLDAAAAAGSAARGDAAVTRGTPLPKHRRVGKHADAGHELGVAAGLAALSLDALSSVAYGPEAMVLVLVTAGAGALRFTLPLTLVITGMLALLVVSYTQVIAAHPEGGGAYAVAKLNLGRVAAMLGAASLVVDYVLTVAVSLAAGAASLGSVFPALAHHLLLVSLVGLALLTAVNMLASPSPRGSSCCRRSSSSSAFSRRSASGPSPRIRSRRSDRVSRSTPPRPSASSWSSRRSPPDARRSRASKRSPTGCRPFASHESAPRSARRSGSECCSGCCSG